ncbi:SDR family oxidoreductase [Nereida sp. MMG025]|uniref:SDR family oxidoreductase n=1 Tax=Nereida sp. MMG025 TaxID=2909981 RepID=UPI001F201AD5|nr:SDR family oxidoreductase [Nereida sp. MMG025]MCF6445214.1 SDR family oxidoreductase [Nereida sp. MMG025]
MSRFEGKRILITGGTSGIGFATAQRIVDEGGEVAVTGTTQDHLDEAGRTLPSGSLVLRNDAGDPKEARILAEKIKNQMGEIDGAFLNAGFGQNMATEEVDAEGFDAMMNVNVRGPALQMAHLKPLISDGGAVVLTASVAPYLGGAKGAIYAATKASCAAMARSWAKDLAGRGIRVNSVAPGPIETNFFDDLGTEDGGDLKEQIAQAVPLGRMGRAQEVAAVATFLLSEDASYVSGSEYMVDGGMTLR